MQSIKTDNLRTIFKRKMLKEKLDFLSLEDSIELYESNYPRETRFHWVARSEELENNGDDMTTEEILTEVGELYGLDSDYGLTIGDEDTFDEFTLVLCPAYTYIDLL